MVLVECLLAIAVCGAIGGIVNAYFTDNGFAMPKWEDVGGLRIWRPGFFGNVVVGIIAAVVSWGLYGPFANVVVIPLSKAPSDSSSPTVTLASVVGAILIGIGGAKWLTSEVDKKALRATAATAAASNANAAASARIAISRPFEALQIAKQLSIQ